MNFQPEKLEHLLIVDDDREIRDLMARYFKRHGYRVTAVEDGREMKRALDNWSIDLIVLDLMLPGEDGLTLCRDLRARSKIPVIMLTAMGEEMDRIVGLEVGADDYLPKPCNPRELLARIRAVLRRTHEPSWLSGDQRMTVLRFEGWELDTRRRELKAPDGQIMDMSIGELELLSVLARNAQRVMTRDQILDCLKGRWMQPFERSVDMQISRLRKKMEPDATSPTMIKTVRNGGYVFTPSVTVE